MRKVKSPSRQKNSTITSWEQEQFVNLYRDVPASEIPQYSLTEVINVLLYGLFAEVRPGTKLWAAANLPSLKEDLAFSAGGRPLTPLPSLSGRQDYEATKTGDLITKTEGQDFSSPDVGSFFVWPDGTHDLIIAYVSVNTVRVNSSASHTAATASEPGSIRGPINAVYWHDETRRFFIHIGPEVYYSDYQLLIYTKIYSRSAEEPGNVKGNFDENQRMVYLFANGIFQIDTYDWEMYKINTPVYECDMHREELYRTSSSELTDTVLVPTEDDQYIYGRRYLNTMSRLDGDGFRNRGTPDTAIRKETGSNLVRTEDNFQDFREAWYMSRASVTEGDAYQVVIGGVLAATVDDFKSVVEGSFTCGVDVGGGLVTRDIVVHLGDIDNFFDVAAKLEEAIRAAFPDADGMPENPPFVRFVDDHFIFSGGADDQMNTGSFGTVAPLIGTDLGVNGLPELDAGNRQGVYFYYANHVLGSHKERALRYNAQYQYTHYPVYSTRYVNDAAINDTKYIWQQDVPVAKAFSARITSQGTVTTVTLSAGTLERMDIGSYMKFESGTEYRIVRYINSASFATESTFFNGGTPPDEQTQGACIGDGRVTEASQTADLVTRNSPDGNAFTADMVGKLIFWADGTYSYVIEFISATQVRVLDRTVHVNQGITWMPLKRNYNDIITDSQLKAREESQSEGGSYFTLQQRFHTPLPDCLLGVQGPLFMYVAQADGGEVQYSTSPPGFPYLVAHHNIRYQTHKVKDSIVALDEIADRIIIYCARTTQYIQPNITNQITDDIGIVTSVISGIGLVTGTIGIKNKGSIAKMPNGNHVVITSEPAVRQFDAYRFGPNLARDADGLGHIQNELEQYQPMVSAGYDRLYGYMFWANDQNGTVWDFNTSWRKGIEQNQPQNWMRFGGDWVSPEPQIGAFDIFDDQNQRITLVFDMYSGVPYMLTSREGPANSNITKVWLDKVGTGYDIGTEIPWALGFKEHRGKREEDIIRLLNAHFRLRPQDEANQGVSGYTANGYRNAQEVTVQVYEDGSVSQSSITRNIPNKADVAFDRQIDANRIQLRLSGTASELKITSHKTDYDDFDRRGAPSQRVMTEQGYQAELGAPSFWISRGGTLLDRASGETPSGSIFGYGEGPDGEYDSAFIFAAASELTYSHSETYDGDFTCMFAMSNIIGDVEICRIGDMRISVSGSYTLTFNDGANVYTEDLEWNGTGWVYIKITRIEDNLRISENGTLLGRQLMDSVASFDGDIEFVSGNAKRLFDFRIFDLAVTENANNYWYLDIIEKQGLALLPL